MKTKNLTNLKWIGNQRGMALLLAIIFMAILSILGAVVLDVANREMKMIGGYRAGGDYSQDRAGLMPEKEAFYLVDRTVQYSLNTRVIEAINDKINAGQPPVINFMNETTTDANGNNITHNNLIRAGGLSLTSGTITQLGVAELSFAQINRIATGASAKDIFIRYHLSASACPANVNCNAFPDEAVRVDSHLVEVRPNPSGSSGSSEESGASIWGKI